MRLLVDVVSPDGIGRVMTLADYARLDADDLMGTTAELFDVDGVPVHDSDQLLDVIERHRREG